MEAAKKQPICSELDCPICYQLMVQPVTITCGHSFCYNCIVQSVEIKRSCPFCRVKVPSDFNYSIDTELQQRVCKDHNKQYLKAKKELIKANKWENKMFSLKFNVGNKYRKLKNGTASRSNPDLICDNEFTLYTEFESEKLTSKIIQKVTYKLHETYANPIKDILHAPFTFTARAWGYFVVEVTISFRSYITKKPVTVYHELCFETGGCLQEFQFQFDKKQIPRDVLTYLERNKKSQASKLVTKRSIILDNIEQAEREEEQRQKEELRLKKLKEKYDQKDESGEEESEFDEDYDHDCEQSVNLEDYQVKDKKLQKKEPVKYEKSTFNSSMSKQKNDINVGGNTYVKKVFDRAFKTGFK